MIDNNVKIWGEASSVVVLIPHYNNIDGLEKTICSIDESEKVDVVIVDDGSLVKPNIDLIPKNPSLNEVFIVSLSENKGICYALNTGLDFIVKKGYQYIGRIDCDDLSIKNRFLLQKNYLESHEVVGLVGSQTEYVSKEYQHLYSSNKPLKISRGYLFAFNPFSHSSIMFHKKVFDKCGFYPVNWKYNEDHAYWFNISNKFSLEIMDDILVKTQINPSSQSPRNYRKQRLGNMKLLVCNFEFKYIIPFFIGIGKAIIACIFGYRVMCNICKVLKS